MWLQGVEILADRREETAVDSVDHLQRERAVRGMGGFGAMRGMGGFWGCERDGGVLGQ